jgi:hypothetical protein
MFRELSNQGGLYAPAQSAYIEAQAKQRTSYLSREMVMPLSVSLYDRVILLAQASLRCAPVDAQMKLEDCAAKSPTTLLITE